uniref:serine hydrolase domain-containing protein n=1 Tax=Paenibacillus sp. IHBB 10380 TaxID=1566358 RepID=UPI001F2E0CA3|nr:serine hydrolase domain-containing protein [Paenibacillus sp. IHBB 10380]
MMKSRWIMGVVLSSCLLLASCDDNKAPAETQNIAGALNTSEPTAAMDSPSSKALITYEVTRNYAKEKADLLTKAYDTNSVQYALIDQGKIDLDKPVVQYIPEFAMKDERYKQITPRMLLNHSSGLNGSSQTNAFLFEDNDTYAHDTLLKELADQTLKANPGAFSVYCNDGFTLAEIVAERVSGMNFTSFIHRYITEPLGMTNTKTPLDSLDTAKMAGLYYPTYAGQLPNETLNAIGSGGIYSTAEDLTRFSQVFTGEAEEVLSGKSAAAMAQDEYKTPLWPDDADNSFEYGLGWDSVNLYPFSEYGIKALTKGGDTVLYHACIQESMAHHVQRQI